MRDLHLRLSVKRVFLQWFASSRVVLQWLQRRSRFTVDLRLQQHVHACAHVHVMCVSVHVAIVSKTNSHVHSCMRTCTYCIHVLYMYIQYIPVPLLYTYMYIYCTCTCTCTIYMHVLYIESLEFYSNKFKLAIATYIYSIRTSTIASYIVAIENKCTYACTCARVYI